MKNIFVWLFQDFIYKLYDLAENKFTLAITTHICTKSFSPPSTQLGVPTTLMISVTNPNNFDAAIGFNDNLQGIQPGMEVANPPMATLPTSGIVPLSAAFIPPVILPGATIISGSATVLAGATATFSVKVVVPIGFPMGQYNNKVDGGYNAIPPYLPSPFAVLTIIGAANKKRKAFGAPLCFDPSAFPDRVCPETFIYKQNSASRGVQLYRIGDTCCYTQTPPNQRR